MNKAKYIFLLFIVAITILFIKISKNTPRKEVTLESIANKEEITLPEKITWPVPFTPQAPTGNWINIIQGNGCEEATILMAYSWSTGKNITPELAVKEIINISDYSLKTLGHFHDISNEDTLRLLREYFKFNNAYLEKEVNLETIKTKLVNEKIIIVAVNGDKLNNPYYQIPKPANHKIIIIGYDETKKEFVTNDPGTSKGEKFNYKYGQLLEAVTDYPTGYKESFETAKKSMIVVEKE